ncbi:MAG: PAS domain S-box protein [Colwellia sp.]|nr:PAS domain S-box protein [Colwellia sp.]
MNKKLKLYFVILVSFSCILPLTLNLLGFDFSSISPPLNLAGANLDISPDQQFYALTGALHHALLEWSAVTLAMIVGVGAFVHYYQNKDISIPIIGLALLCAGVTDAFHTLAATRIISASVPNGDFIPFTWAFSRIFNASIMIFGVLISLWLTRASGQQYFAKKTNIDGNAATRGIGQTQTLFIISILFITLAISAVIWAATSQHLPQTTFKNAFITRPYDVVPLALFILSAALVWIWYQRKASVLKFSLLLSLIPEVVTQLHMSFGSTALFDNHFNIAHFLKIVAYGVLTLGILITLLQSSKALVSQHQSSNKGRISESSYAVEATEGLLDVGKAKYSQVLVFSSFTFILAIIVSALVSGIYYIDAIKVTQAQQHKILINQGDFIELLLKNIYQQPKKELGFLSDSLTIPSVTHSKNKQNVVNNALWHQRFIGHFSDDLHQLKLAELTDKKMFFADEQGHIIYQVHSSKNDVSASMQSIVTLSQLFPALTHVITTNQTQFQLGMEKGFVINSSIKGHYRTITLPFEQRDTVIRLFIQMDQKASLAEIDTVRNRSLQIGFGLAIVALAIALVMSRRLSSALQTITTQVTQYSHTGEIKHLPIDAPDESGVLARSFHNLLITQAAQDKALLQQKWALDEHAIVSIADIKGNITYINEKFSQISGYSEAELLGKNHRILNSNHHPKSFFTEMFKQITQGKTWQSDICNKAKDGHLYWVNTTVVPFMNNNGRPESYISIRTDITHNKHQSELLLAAKVELSKQVDKLEAVNVELNQFAYVASHDLKSPLNGISQLVMWLEEDCYEILPVESQEHLRLLKNRSKRMITLLNDLLNYSRAGRTEYHAEEFNLAVVVNNIFDLHGNRDGFSCVTQDINLFLQKVPFELIIRNLISNALKHHDKNHGCIEVSVKNNVEFGQNYYLIHVQDDGPGIPVNMHEKAVEMFQTLQSRDKTEGSGMGLALVKKTIEHQGGSLSIKVNEGRGTLIIVKWPYVNAS